MRSIIRILVFLPYPSVVQSYFIVLDKYSVEQRQTILPQHQHRNEYSATSHSLQVRYCAGGCLKPKCGMPLPGVSWITGSLCIYILGQSCWHAASVVFPAGVVFWTMSTSCLNMSSSLLSGWPYARCARHTATPSVGGLGRPKPRRFDPEGCSRIGILRGGAETTGDVVGSCSDGTTKRTHYNTRPSFEVAVAPLGVEWPAEREDPDKRSKRWLLEATELDRSEIAYACVCGALLMCLGSSRFSQWLLPTRPSVYLRLALFTITCDMYCSCFSPLLR